MAFQCQRNERYSIYNRRNELPRDKNDNPTEKNWREIVVIHHKVVVIAFVIA